MSRVIATLVLAGVIAGLAITSAGATVRDVGQAPSAVRAAAAPPNADADGDKVFENLSARLETLEADDRLSVIVRLGSDLTSARAAAVERAAGGFELTRWLPIVDGFAATMTKAQVQALGRLSSVASIEENGVVRALNDSAQESFGVTRARSDVPGLDGNTDGNLAAYSKNDVVVAVVDTGIDATHPQLDDGKLIAFANCLNQPTPSTCSTPAAFDDNDHGTHVAGTIVGDGEGDARYKGVAPGAALVGVKVLGANQSGSTAGVISGIQWVVQNKATYGIEAINLSLGADECSNGTDASSIAAEAAVDAGLVVLVAGGNSGPGPCTVVSPGAAPRVITVGALADMGVPSSSSHPDWAPGFKPAHFSSRGPTGDGRIKPDIAAPGVHITSANASNANNGTAPYVTFNGTSMATPFVAGVALLMLEANPALTHAQVKSTLMSTALDWGRGGAFHDPGTSGPDVDYGAGRLDAFAAINAAGAPLGAAPAAPEHTLFADSLSGTGASREHKVVVTSTSFPLAGTLIMPRWSSATNPDFDLRLYGPSGGLIAQSISQLRQDQVGTVVTQTGTYKFVVNSDTGAGGYILDVSGATPAPPPTVPGAPTGVTATAGIGEAAVRWSDPASDGGEPITNYVVTPYVGTTAQPAKTVPNGVFSDEETVVLGLTNGTTYTFKVRARNAVGDGADSAASNPVTPRAPASTSPRWPMYGHDAAHTGRAAADGPTELTPAWSFPLGLATEANNSPVVGPDGSIYVTTQGKLFAVNADGTLRCETSISSSGAAPAISNDGAAVYVPTSGGLGRLSSTTCAYVWWDRGSPITSSSPTIGPDGTIYFGSGSESGGRRLYALNPDGTTKCEWASGSLFGIESSPALGPNGEIYFVHGDLGLVALDSACQLDWTRSDLGQVANTPSVGPDGTVYIGNWNGLHAVNPADGSTEDGWPVAVDAFAMAKASASISQDGSRLYRGDDGGEFYAFSNDAASVACSYETGAGGIYSAPALAANDVVYFTKAATNANLYALDASDCTLVDTYQIGHSESSPALGADGTLYVLGDDSSGNGVLYAFPPPPVAAPPNTLVSSGPVSGSWVRPSASFMLASEPAGASFECRVNGGAWVACSSPRVVQTVVPGQHLFEFRAVNAAGVDTSPASRELRVVRAFAADWDANGKADVAVWRPANGGWYAQTQATGYFGRTGDAPVPGQWDADAAVDRAVFRPQNGGWYVEGSATVYHGQVEDVPVPGQWDADAPLDHAVWRPRNGGWYLRGIGTFYFGQRGDVPVPGDYDADPELDLTVFRPSNGGWYVQGSATVFHGAAGDVPVPADWNGDGKTDIAVYRPSNSTWYLRGISTTAFGLNGDVPVVGDFDADAALDRAVWRPGNGGWFVEGSPTVFFGSSTDIP